MVILFSDKHGRYTTQICTLLDCVVAHWYSLCRLSRSTNCL